MLNGNPNLRKRTRFYADGPSKQRLHEHPRWRQQFDPKTTPAWGSLIDRAGLLTRSWRERKMKDLRGSTSLSVTYAVKLNLSKSQHYMKTGVLFLHPREKKKKNANRDSVSYETHPFCHDWQVSSSLGKELDLINQSWQVLLHARRAQLLPCVALFSLCRRVNHATDPGNAAAVGNVAERFRAKTRAM